MQEISMQAQAQAKTAHAAYMDSIAGLSASKPFPTTLSAFEELKNNPSLYQLKTSLNEIFRQMARCETNFWYTTCFCRNFDRKWHPNVPILRFMAQGFQSPISKSAKGFQSSIFITIDTCFTTVPLQMSMADSSYSPPLSRSDFSSNLSDF
jgi:hypothetical protein